MKIRHFQESLRTSVSQIQIMIQDQDSIRQPPQMIRQHKLTKTYSKLQCIPLQIHIETLNPFNIQHLYLSHNNIKSIKGIEQYLNLVSLNVSYNCLTVIEELNLIQNPQILLRIGLRMNDFVYGYQDYAVKVFENLERLDDIDVKDKNKVKQLQMKGQQVANKFLQFHIRIERVFEFMDDLIKQEKIHQEMGLRPAQFKTIHPKLKLLFEHMTEDFIAKVSQIYIMPSQQEFLQLSSLQIVNKISQIISITLEEGIDLKCICRPRISFQLEIKKNFNSICSNLLQRFSLRYNNELQNGLIKIEKKLKLIYPQRQWEIWELWGMLQNYQTLTTGGKRYDNLINTQKQNYPHLLNQTQHKREQKRIKKQSYDWRDKVFSNQQNSEQSKENYCPNVQTQNAKVRNVKNVDKLQNSPQMFYDRIPIVLCEKNYIEVLLQITMGKVKEMLQKYDYLNQAKTKTLYLIQNQTENKLKKPILHDIYRQFQTIKDSNAKTFVTQKIPIQSKNSGKQTKNNSSCKKTKRNRFKDDLAENFKSSNEQAMLKSTVVNNSPLYSQTAREISVNSPKPFLKRNDSEISFGANKQELDPFKKEQDQARLNSYNESNKNQRKNCNSKQQNIDFSIHDINLIYKVFRALKTKVVQTKMKLKRLRNNQ